MTYKEIRTLLKGIKCKIEVGVLGIRIEPKDFYESVKISNILYTKNIDHEMRPTAYYIKK